MRVTSHVRGDLGAATLVLVPGRGAWSSVPCWPRLLPQSLLSDVPLPGSASRLHPGPRWPPLGSWALCTAPRAWRARGEVMASRRPPGSPVTRAHAGEGVRVAEAAV